MKIFLFIAALFSTAIIPVEQGLCEIPTAREIIERSDRAVRGSSQAGIFEIVIKTRRWTRTLQMKSWEIRKPRKSFTEITAPEKDAGNRFLLIGQDMRHFIPRLQRDIRISPSMMLQSWMGSDFTNDDIVKESSIIDDYIHSIIGREQIAGHECYKLQLIPKAGAAVVWGKIIYYARVNDYLPAKEEFYNEHNVLKKVLTFSEYKKMHNRIIPTLKSTPQK